MIAKHLEYMERLTVEKEAKSGDKVGHASPACLFDKIQILESLMETFNDISNLFNG